MKTNQFNILGRATDSGHKVWNKLTKKKEIEKRRGSRPN